MLERRARRGEHARLTEDREPVVVDVGVQLVPRRPIERPAAVRPDLRAYSQLAQERERTPSGGGAREVEMHRHRAALQMPRAADVEERRHLGEAAAATVRRDLGEFVAELLGEGHLQRHALQREQAALVLDAELAVRADPVRGDHPVSRDERRQVAASAERARGPGGARVAGESGELAVRSRPPRVRCAGAHGRTSP